MAMILKKSSVPNFSDLRQSASSYQVLFQVLFKGQTSFALRQQADKVSQAVATRILK